jgi:NAD+ synthase
MYEFDAKKVKDELIQWIRNCFETNGKDCKAVIGISGGVDSSVVAALCVEALGKERVLGVLMPNGEQEDIGYSHFLCQYLHIGKIVVPIHKVVRAIKYEVKTALDDHWSVQSSINLPPRVRMASLYAVSQTVKGRVINTSNLSESWVGWDTRYGDSVGDFSPLGKLTKTEIKMIGIELGLPEELINKTPLDGLCGKTDEESFGFTYDILDRYIRTGKIDNIDIKEKIDSMHEKNLFKLEPMPTFTPDLN